MEKFKAWWGKHKAIAIVGMAFVLALLAYLIYRKNASSTSAAGTVNTAALPTTSAPASSSGSGGTDLSSLVSGMQQGFDSLNQAIQAQGQATSASNTQNAQGLQTLAQSFAAAIQNLKSNTSVSGQSTTGATLPNASQTYSQLNQYVNGVMQYAANNFAGKAVSSQYANYSSGLAAAHQSANAARTILAQQGQAFSSTYNSDFVQNLVGQLGTAQGSQRQNIANQISEAGGGVIMQTPTGGNQLVVSTNNGLQYHNL